MIVRELTAPEPSLSKSQKTVLCRDFARSHKLRISGSWYQRLDPLRWTWCNVAGNAVKEIDHILVSTRWRILQNCRVYRSAKFYGTGHRLVVATLQVHFKTPQRSTDHPWVFHLDRLRERECARGFAEAIWSFQSNDLTDPVFLWDTFKCERLDAAQESIGERPSARWNFISHWKPQMLVTRFVEGHFLVNDLRPAYQALKKLNSKPSSQVTTVRLVSGQIVTDPVAVRERWAEYFEQLYQVDPATADGESMAWGLHAVLAAIWRSGTIPPDLLRVVVIPLLKGKGDRWDCSNHRGITLVSVPGKVLACILLRRIRDHLLRHQSHCGATLGNIKVTDLDFADDESFETLVVTLDALSNEAKPLGLEVSWTKTKIQDFGDLLYGNPAHQLVSVGDSPGWRRPVGQVVACADRSNMS
ncbi:uncharacterized protein [Penaeus vannamei]|uniref:uncharacterized protein n=1 Tax=Penaeus vannamei TaxID=6689 RepID=UPI00387F4337